MIAVCLLALALLITSALAADGSPLFLAATFSVATLYIASWLLWGSPRTTFRANSAARDAARGTLLGVLLAAIFLGSALVVREIPALAGPAHDLLNNTREGVPALALTTLLVNGVAEEVFYRRTLIRHLAHSRGLAIAGAMLLYMMTAAGLGVPLLVAAAIPMGALTHWEAEKTRSLVSPIFVHIAWSLGMFFLLPHFLS